MLRAMPPARPLGRLNQQPQISTVIETEAPVVVQRVTITPAAPARSDLLTDQWGHEELRDYVVAQIIEHFGAFPRNMKKEHGIFTGFVSRYGADATTIAKYVFGPACEGWWRNSPVSVNRFCKGSDPYFGDVILARLKDVGQA